MPERDCLFMTQAEDCHSAIHEARSSIIWARKEIERLESGREITPEATLIAVQREYGAGASIDSVIEKQKDDLLRAERELEEAESFPQEWEEALCELIGREHPHNAAWQKAAKKFRSLYGAMHPTHTKWVIGLSAVEAEFDFGDESVFERRSGWGEDGIWRAGDNVYETIAIDPLSPNLQAPVKERATAHCPSELLDAILSSVRKVAVIVRYHERVGRENEAFRCHWRHWLNIAISTLAQTTGVNYYVVVDDTDGLPDAGTIEAWEAEVNVLDSEDQAKLRLWESVYSRAIEDEEWATHLERDAEKTRVWAKRKRERIEAERGREAFADPGIGRLKGPAPTVMARAPRICNARRRRVPTTRRVRRGGDSGDDPPGASDSAEPALGRRRPKGLYV